MAIWLQTALFPTAGATGMISAFLSINPALIRGNQIKRL